MKSHRTLKFTVLLLFIFTGFLQGQVNQSSIRGFVFDTENQPAQFSTVVLMDQDSVFMKGALSNSDGSFLFDNLGSGNYHIMIRNVEFNTHISELIEIIGTNHVELEHIQLEPRINDLEEVVIKGEKAMVEVHPDKMVVNVSASANAAGNNALELIGKSPGVVVDMNKNIVLQGKSGVQIYINGRPSRISGDDLSTMLESMSSEEIESLELITNPSARYDAEGTAGIINIIMKTNPGKGFNGRLQGNYSIGEKPRTGIGTSLNYSGSRINMFTSINLSDNTYYSRDYSSKQRGDYMLEENADSPTRVKGINLSAGMDYQFNREHSMSFDARVLLNEQTDNMRSHTSIEDISGINDLEILVSEATEDAQSQNINTNLNYTFKPNKSTSFSADVSYGIFLKDNITLQPNDYYNSDMNLLLRSVDSRFSTETDIDIFSVLADFEKSLGSLTITAGAKYSYINTDNRLATFDIVNDLPVQDVNQSNDFTYLEKVAAIYSMLDFRLNPKLNLSVGLRVENTSSLGELISANPGPDDVVPRNYTSLFPNISLAYNDQENHALSLSIGRRITRPNYQNLNPFEWKSSELSSWKGNPFLQPNYIENYQLSYSFRRKLVVSNTFSVTHNFFANVFLGDGEKGNVLGPQNLDKVTNNGLSVSYPLTVSKWWQFSTFLIYNYVNYGGNVEGAVIDLSANIFNARMQNNLRLPLGIQMEISGYYTTPWIWGGTVNVDGYLQINAGLRRSFFNDRLMFQASANDLFDTGSDYYYKSNYGGMIVDGVIFFDGRRFAVSASYSFGNQKVKTRRSKSALDEELKRLSE